VMAECSMRAAGKSWGWRRDRVWYRAIATRCSAAAGRG
jgi:hypothetical protein